MDLYRINICYFKSDGGAMFGVVPKAIWTKFFPADERNLIPMILRSLVIRTDDDHLILIDNGIGDKQDDDHQQYLHIDEIDGLVTGLAAQGIKPEEITDMILTHLHFDHCGGGITYNWNREPVAVFPEATYWTTERQWDNAVNPNPREADSYLRENLIPMEDLGLLDFVLHPGNFCEGVDLRIVNGHTPGQLIPVIKYKGKTLVFGADLIPTHGHIPVKYNMAYDLEVVKTMKEKQTFLEEIVDNNYVLMFQHDTMYECCTVKKTDKGGFRMDQAMTLEEFKNL